MSELFHEAPPARPRRVSGEYQQALLKAAPLCPSCKWSAHARMPGTSIAAGAMQYGIGADIVQRWLREESQGMLANQPQTFVPVPKTPQRPGVTGVADKG